MDVIKRDSIQEVLAKGRALQKIFGKSGAVMTSDNMIALFAHFSPKYGSMESHYHETEYMYVIDAKDAYATYGDSLENFDSRCTLKKGDILRPYNGEWHRFDFTSDDGYVDFINFFAVAENHVVTDEMVKG